VEIWIKVIVFGIIILSFGFDTWLSVLNYRNRNAPIPEEVSDVYDKKEYDKWLEYNMESYRFSTIMSIVNTVIFIIFLAFGVFVLFNDWAVSIVDNPQLQILIFLLFYFLFSFIVGIFPSYYRNFKIEEKYGFNKMTMKTFIVDKIKNLILTLIFGGGLVYLLITIYDNAGKMFIVYAWLALMVILLIVNVLYVQLIVPLFNKLTPLEDGELKDEIFAFAKKVGYSVSQINVIDASKRSTKLNAYFSGFGKLKKIVLYDTLIEKMSTEEIVAVLAHEIGHNKYKHMWSNIGQMFITLLLYMGTLALVLENEVFSTAFGFTSSNFGFALILFMVLLEPIQTLIGLLTSYISRKHEYQSDAFAAKNYSKESIESALKVLSRENYSNLTPHPLYVKLTYSHPPTVDRIKAIRKVEVK